MKKFLLVLVLVMVTLANVAICINDDYKEPTDSQLVSNYVNKEFGVRDGYDITIEPDSDDRYIYADVKLNGKPYKYCCVLRTYAEQLYKD